MTDKGSAMPAADLRVRGSFSATYRISHASQGENRLHGHTYELAAKLSPQAGLQGNLIFRFEELAAIVKSLCEELNKGVLLASGGENVHKDDSIAIEYVSADDKRYVLPMDDVKLIPVEEITTEALASWIGSEIATRLGHIGCKNIREVEIMLHERGHGCCTVITRLA